MAPLSKKNKRIRAAMSLTTRVVQCALKQGKHTWCNYVQIIRLNAKLMCVHVCCYEPTAHAMYQA
eukprot:3786938-Heterocapsa_arctica.AAC.1